MTEKNYNPEQKQMKSMRKLEKVEKQKPATEAAKQEIKKEKEIIQEQKEETKQEKETEKKIESDKKVEEIKKKEKQKKAEAIVNGVSLPVSTLDSIYICSFIKRKPIQRAVADLEDVLKFKKAIPMKGEIPHRKGKGMMSGRYPINTVKQFIKLLKNLQANANVNGLEEPVITEAIANKASQPYGRFGRIRRKRTHVKIKAMEKKIKEKRK